MSKRGRLSKEERDYIHANAGKKTPEEIAEAINRTVEMVKEFIKLNVRPAQAAMPNEAEQAQRIVIRQELRTSEAWKNLKGEFDTEELRFFEEGYVKLMSQFKGDVLPSEETQIFQAIKFEILMSRNLKERRKARDDIGRLEKMQESFLADFDGDPSAMTDAQKAFALDLETQLNAARQAEQSRTNEYVKLQERHEALMKSLKAVRDQRIKQIENSKVSYLGVVKMLMEKDVQAREGRQMELMKLAGRQALTDLGRPIKYDDGNEDSPILSSDTVDLGPEEDGEV